MKMIRVIFNIGDNAHDELFMLTTMNGKVVFVSMMPNIYGDDWKKPKH